MGNPQEDLFNIVLKGIKEASSSKNDSEKDFRSPFEKEYDKVIFSDYFRALSDKTQVVPMSEKDHNHTRLTHSLEVAIVGRSLGTKLYNYLLKEKSDECKEKEALKHIPKIIETACLLHDIGNPPFGHAGEEAIKKVFKSYFSWDNEKKENYSNGKMEGELILSKSQLQDFIRFDGNANGFRIATRLAGKRNIDERPNNNNARLLSGLGLSRITLMAGVKYPFASGSHPDGKDKSSYFQSEKEIFEWLNNNTRHPFVYLVEAADDICNLVMDFEDAVKNGHTQILSLTEDIFKEIWGQKGADFKSEVKNPPSDIFVQTVAQQLKISNDEALEIIQKLSLIKDYDSNKPILTSELKAIEAVRASVIGMLIKGVWGQFEENLEGILKGDITKNNKNDEDKAASLLEKYFHKKGVFKEVEALRDKYLLNSLYCHKRKASIEISGYKITDDLLRLFLDAISEYKKTKSRKNKKSFKDCSTQTQHLLRYLGITPSNWNESQTDPYQLCLMVTDFYTKASDKEITLLYQSLSGQRFV